MKRVLVFYFSIIANVALCLGAWGQTGGAGTEHASAPQTPAPQGQNGPSARLGAYVYPKNHQTESQQAKDENECYAWAKQQTGIDPDSPASAQPQPQAKQAKGGAVKGGAGGAAGGAAVGAIAGDAGTGAAIGATAGAVRGRRQQKKANKEAEKQGQQQAGAQQQESLNKVKSAFSSCIDARGYSVK